ncbi:uncharacterized protein LOC109948964 isoform X2 [Prunus persica]|uniref:uncharacterized protein LOC109948964 isoform X2 n=1 Tax=Prunus persica TaxID=3760 RepID=UPI0009AB8C3C|nr:uncharacterized protein LOC109948964 isoform X2 [Prunus persica]
MLSALTTKVRLVRCPKCRQLLPELPDFQVYMCGGCGATLKARGLDRLPLLGNGSHDGNSDHDDQHYWKTGSDDSSLGDYDEQINVASVVGSVDSNPSVSPLASISARVLNLFAQGSDDFNPRVSTDYDDRAL